jgi:hypothetical protein
MSAIEKAQTISNFAKGQIHGGNSGIARIGYKFSRKGAFHRGQQAQNRQDRRVQL